MAIDSVAAVKRLPVGTRLTLMRTLMGRQSPVGRIVKAVRSKDVVFTVDQPGHKHHGEDSYLRLTGCVVVPTDKGFRVYESKGGELAAEYEFAGAP